MQTRTQFPAQFARASLKHGVTPDLTLTIGEFPAQFARASLKQYTVDALSYQAGRISRAICAGLIEAG